MTLSYFSSCPQGQASLDLASEYNRLRSTLQAIDPQFLGPHWPAVTLHQFGVELGRPPRPHIVHFSGHGTGDGGAWFHSDTTVAAPATREGLARMLGAFAGSVRLAVWMHCNSNPLARMLASHLEAAIGIDAEIEDMAAVPFVPVFYAQLAFGTSLSRAFEVARGRVESEFSEVAERFQLHVREGIDADSIYFRDPSDVRESGAELRIFIQTHVENGVTVAFTSPSVPVPKVRDVRGRVRHPLEDGEVVIDVRAGETRIKIFAQHYSKLIGLPAVIIVDTHSHMIPSLNELPLESLGPGEQPCILNLSFPHAR